MSRRFAVPWRGVCSSPGRELLGVITSRGPSRESYTPSRKSRGWPAEAIATSAADARLSAEGMRAAFSSPAGAPAVLQPALPGGGAAMVAVESTAALPGEGGGQTETEQPKRCATGSGSGAGNQQSQRQLTRSRG